MLGTITATVVRVVTTTNDLGDSTTSSNSLEVPGVLFEPQQGAERTDRDSPGVVTPAKFYLPIPLELDADDAIIDAAGVRWEVIAGSSVWGSQTEVAVQRASQR